MIAAVDNSNKFNTALRIRDGDPEGKTFGRADLAAGGETALESKIVKLGLSNLTDLDITETDANITNSPYSEVRLRYLAAAYNREVDSATKRDFGIVIDCGTYSQSNGASASSTLFTSAGFVLGVGEALADYTGGSLIIHEQTDQGTHTISGTPVDNAGTLEITLTGALTATESNLSFTMQRATPLNVAKNDIYEKVQYQMRQASDVNESGSTVVVGKTADQLLTFVGPTMKAGTLVATNPLGGGTGVIVEGFDPNDTNSLEFEDSGGTIRTFPFVAAGNLNFSQNLVDDLDGEYWLYFNYTTRTTNSDIDTVGPSGDTYDLEGTLPTLSVDDYIQVSGFAQEANNGLFIVTVVNVSGSDYTVRKVDGTAVGTAETNQTVSVDQNPISSPDAIQVNDNAGSPIVGAVSSTSIAFDFAYTTNTQGGRTADTDASVALVAMGEDQAQGAINKVLTITKSTGLSFSLTAALERNYSNP